MKEDRNRQTTAIIILGSLLLISVLADRTHYDQKGQ